jgi:hypothetical protein
MTFARNICSGTNCRKLLLESQMGTENSKRVIDEIPNWKSFNKETDTSSLYPMLIEAIRAAYSLGIKYLCVDCLWI